MTDPIGSTHRRCRWTGNGWRQSTGSGSAEGEGYAIYRTRPTTAGLCRQSPMVTSDYPRRASRTFTPLTRSCLGYYSLFRPLFYFKSFLTWFVCSISTILGTNGLKGADVPLSNKQQTNLPLWRQQTGSSCPPWFPVCQTCFLDWWAVHEGPVRFHPRTWWGDIPPVEDEVDRHHPTRLRDLGVLPTWFLDGLDLSEARPDASDRFPAWRQQTGSGCRTRFPCAGGVFSTGVTARGPLSRFPPSEPSRTALPVRCRHGGKRQVSPGAGVPTPVVPYPG